MRERPQPSWPVVLLAALCIGAIVAAALLVGPAPATTTSISRTATVQRGVVQSTVSGTGNLEPMSELDLGFKTSGTVTNVYVHQGEQVAKGQLLATLDPSSAEVTLEQARASLQSAEANLAAEEEDDGEGTQGTGGASSSASTASVRASVATAGTPATDEAGTGAAGDGTPSGAAPRPTGTGTSGTGTSGTGTSGTQGTTTPDATTKSGSKGGSKTTSSGRSGANTSSSAGSTGASSGSSTKATLSTAAREANIASARAAVRTDRLSVRSDEQALQDTKLYAPEDGTIASLSGQVGEVVSGGGTTRASTSSSTSSSASSSASALGGSSTGAGASGSGSGGSGSGGSGSSSFAVLSNLSSMKLVVALSESEVDSVHPGQIATVTVEALEGRKLAAHVAEVAILSTSGSGAASYDVTFDLDQLDEGIKPGMSATAEVVVKQASGLNVPSSAITDGTVTVVSGSRREVRRVTTGLAGDSSTIVLSGLQAGETVALPSVTTTKSTLGSGLGSGRTTRGLGGFGGAGGGAFAIPGGGGGGAFFRGGG